MNDNVVIVNGGIKATEKATQKIRESCLMTELPNFFFLVYKCTLSVLIVERQICSFWSVAELAAALPPHPNAKERA